MNLNFRISNTHDERVRRLTREFLQEHRAYTRSQCMHVSDQTARYAEWKHTAIYRFLCAVYPEELRRVETEDRPITPTETTHA